MAHIALIIVVGIDNCSDIYRVPVRDHELKILHLIHNRTYEKIKENVQETAWKYAKHCLGIEFENEEDLENEYNEGNVSEEEYKLFKPLKPGWWNDYKVDNQTMPTDCVGLSAVCVLYPYMYVY